MKPDRTPVTEVDRAVEAELKRILEDARPDDAVLGEEEGTSGAGSRRWIVDPIDGTRNYARGDPRLGDAHRARGGRELRLGVVSAPALGRRWRAERGGGAFLSDDPIQVSSVGRVEDAVLCFAIENAVPAIARRAWHARGFGDFWAHMLVAEGAVDGAWTRSA